MFWKYLDRVYKLPNAKAIVDWLETDGRVAQLKSDLSDPSNFGMAKSIVMLGKNAGFDMTSETEVAEFLSAYNRSLSSLQTSAAPAAKNQRVGRKGPCPCGKRKEVQKMLRSPIAARLTERNGTLL